MLQTLRRFLPLAEKVINRKTTLPILGQVGLRDGYISATDLETTVRMKVNDPRSYTLPLSILKTVMKTRPKLLEIEMLEDNKLKLRYDSRCVTFKSLDPEEFPVKPSGRFRRVGEWTTEIIRKFYKQLPYCSIDELKPALMGVYVSQNKVLSSCATDGHVLRLIKDADPEGKGRLKNNFKGIIPRKSLMILSRVVKGNLIASVSKTHLRLKLNRDTEIYVRLIAEQYPDFEGVIPEAFTGEAVFELKAMLDLLSDGQPFANRETKQAALHLTGKEVRIEVEDPDRDTFWESPLPIISRSGEDIRISMNLVLLERILKGVEDGEVVWHYTTPVSASIFTGANGCGDDAVNLIMPIRLKDEKEQSDG